MTTVIKARGRLAEMNGGYVLLYRSDFGLCMRGRDMVMRPVMVGVTGVHLDRDHNGAPLEPGQSNAVHEGALVGHVRAFEASVMPIAYTLPDAQACAATYDVELAWPVLECTRIFREQLAEVARRQEAAAEARRREADEAEAKRLADHLAPMVPLDAEVSEREQLRELREMKAPVKHKAKR